MAEGHDAEIPEERAPRDLVPADDELTPASSFRPSPGLDVDADLRIAVDLPPAPAPEVPEKRIRLIDVADERNPRIHAVFPEPPDAAEHRTPGLRFGPHNLHENRIGTFQSDTQLFGTYYSGGLRGYEVSSDGRVVETSYLVPPAPAEQDAVQTNDLVVRADGVILFTDRLHGGLYTASLS